MLDPYEHAVAQLEEIAQASEGTVQLDAASPLGAGKARLNISIRFEGIPRVDDGLRVRARERFVVYIPPTFPYRYPTVQTSHRRFAGFPHVQWCCQLCLYRSAADWHPEDGMYGFIARLDAWIRDAALNRLDPDDVPLHPPVAYYSVDRLVVPRVDAPFVSGSAWLGFATLRELNHRTEIVGWRRCGDTVPDDSALAILLHKPLPFEYPETVHALLEELKTHHIEYAPFILLLSSYAACSPSGSPLMIVLGTPMRRVVAGGPLLQHLAVWQISSAAADQLRQFAVARRSTDGSSWDDAVDAVVGWSMSARVGWCEVREMRPEVTQSRDQASLMSWFRGKRVAIWGCGAVGTHVAESVVRAGAVGVELVDNKTVTPGVLVRQGYADADIGRFKVDALAGRLKQIAPDLEVAVSKQDLIRRIQGPDPLPTVDLLIDCTAAVAVRTVLEAALGEVSRRPPIAAIAIDARAASAMATLSMPSHSGGTLDLIRRLKLEVCRAEKLSSFLDAFWPLTPAREAFQPEPGCSEPTFVGSNADLATLSNRLLNATADALRKPVGHRTGIGWLCHATGRLIDFQWSPDHTLADHQRGYAVRVSEQAVREMQAWARRCSRMAGPATETGGLVFGELNDAAGVLWVTDVEGPPPDSSATADHFTCGVEGTAEAAAGRRRRFRGSVDCVGSWHTHPTSEPRPSDIDLAAAAALLGDSAAMRRTCVLLILSGDPDDAALGAYAFRTEPADEHCVQFRADAAATTRIRRDPPPSPDIGLALSGGGSRAMAFHLGCLRALHDLRLLDRVDVVSSVSGGSVIAAMYAYSSDPFPDFDARVVALLRRGLHAAIARETFRLGNMLEWFPHRWAAGCTQLARLCGGIARAILRRPAPPPRVPPLRRYSRTEAFCTVLESLLFGDGLVRDVARGSLQTVINATELRTGSAFRFGSRESGCWRYGTIPTEDARVADAVAASAAYPVYLPALDRRYLFTDRAGGTRAEGVVLTDGGVFDNLGTGPMEPGRTRGVSTNVFSPNYIICFDAGTGLFDGRDYPAKWPSRMYGAFLAVFRKVQDATRKRLHLLAESGHIDGFVLAYLGQNDKALPWFPAGLPTRDEVCGYPTDFAPMADPDIERIALRGEGLTRFLVSYYLPKL